MSTQTQTPQIEAGQRYANRATGRIVHVTKVETTSVHFHDDGDDYLFVENPLYFENDFRPAKPTIATDRRAWIVSAGRYLTGERFTFVTASVGLFPGKASKCLVTWADRRGARNAAKRNGYTPVSGECPYPPITQADKDAYHAEVLARRAARFPEPLKLAA